VAAVTELEMGLKQLDGVGPATMEKLEAMGIYTVMDLAVRSPYDLVDEQELKSDRAIALVNKARAYLSEKGVIQKEFVSAAEIMKRRQSIERISAGCLSLDELLGGGAETHAMTEFYGEFGSGKTSICHTFAAIVQQSKKEGGLGGTAIYIDTESTFRPERIEQIAKARGYDVDKVLKGIIVARAYNSSHQETIVSELGKVVRENHAKLVVVDSVAAHYRAEFIGRGTLAERQQKLNRMLHMLLRTAEVYSLAVVVTNQVLSSPDQFVGNPLHPIGGNVLGHTSTYRIWLRKASKTRIARMIDSPYQAEYDATFVLDERGVSDAPDDKKK
jgi:DNA repair protein RadA